MGHLSGLFQSAAKMADHARQCAAWKKVAQSLSMWPIFRDLHGIRAKWGGLLKTSSFNYQLSTSEFFGIVSSTEICPKASVANLQLLRIVKRFLATDII